MMTPPTAKKKTNTDKNKDKQEQMRTLLTRTSMEGSVYGLKAGLKRSWVMPIAWKKVLIMPMRSLRERL